MIKESLTTLVNSSEINCYNHCGDNSFIENHFNIFKRNLEKTRYEPIGISFNVPYNPHDANMVAYVFKDKGEIRWVHLPEICLLHLLSDLYGRKLAKELIITKLR